MAANRVLTSGGFIAEVNWKSQTNTIKEHLQICFTNEDGGRLRMYELLPDQGVHTSVQVRISISTCDKNYEFQANLGKKSTDDSEWSSYESWVNDLVDNNNCPIGTL